MKTNKILILLSFILVAMMFIGSVAAFDMDNDNDNNLTTDLSGLQLEVNDESEGNEELTISDDSLLSEPQTIVVNSEDGHNEMTNPTIQKVINNANAGDTILINGTSYVHCHFVVNKQLTIKSDIGTTMGVCPGNSQGSGFKGIFYISPEASGTVIEGFTLSNSMVDEDDDYGILVRGASDVIIRNCKVSNEGFTDAIRVEDAKNIIIENVTLLNANNGLNIKSSQNVSVKNSTSAKSKNGINIVDSNDVQIISSNMSENTVAGVSWSGNGQNLRLIDNNVTKNLEGIKLTSSKYIYILSNYIAFNSHNGVYVDNDITRIEIKGNFFNQNVYWDVFNDFHVKNINDISNLEAGELEIINNNYMINVGSGTEDLDRPVWTQVYEYKGAGSAVAQYNYDAANDVYVYVGDGNGEYYGHQGIMFMQYMFDINNMISCPNIYIAPTVGWYKTGPYLLKLSEITQISKGVYSISIVDKNGNIATDLSSVPVTFYLNKNGNSATPQEGYVYKTVWMKNGTATVIFTENFKESGNVITAVFPTPGTQIDYKVSKTLNVNDSDIPGLILNTTISTSGLTTYLKSNELLIVNLTDEDGKAVANKTLTLAIESKILTQVTGGNGQAEFKISLTKEGTYDAIVSFAGDDSYLASSSPAKIVVKKTNTKIISSNVNMIPKMAEYYSITLKDANGNVIAGQKVTFKVNGKTYTKTTNSKGIAKVQLKFTQNRKTYKISIAYKGSNKYKAVSKTNKITVQYSSKTAKLVVPTVTVLPKTSKTYTITLKDANNNGIAKQKVTIKLNGKTYTKTTNSKGQASITVKFDSLKTYTVSASYKGSTIYKKASASGKIKVAKTTTKITAPTVSMFSNEGSSYTITLKTSDNKALAKQKVTIKINGKTYTKTTNSKGQASVTVNLSNEKNYTVTANYAGTAIYKASKATGKITVSKRVSSVIESYNRTFSKDSPIDYSITLRDDSGNALANQTVSYSINGANFSKITDENGKIKIDFENQAGNLFTVVMNYAGTGNIKSTSKTNTVTISNETGIVFVDSDLPNSEIQNILDNAPVWSYVEFLGDYYSDIALIINKGLNIYSKDETILNAPLNTPVLKIVSDTVSISNFVICGNSSDAVEIINTTNVNLINNSILNHLDESKIDSYADGTVNMPGYGVHISNSSYVNILGNSISLFESAIFAEHSQELNLDYNTLRENNYGIKYGFGVANTRITYNEILDSIGLYTMEVPEGPSGYGIFLNNSAVNVTINHNHIAWNHLGISLDANQSTGIVITQNTITDNVLEGIRFNAPYDLAPNAVEPLVTDNAIYRNARGPSMMILGELSANPFGIYAGGLLNPEERLKLDSNWYGTNNVATWDNDTGVVGYGTMCPRISTVGITFNVTSDGFGNYSAKFYKNGEFDSYLPKFDLYATLNRGTDNQVEVVFYVIDGVGTFNFNVTDYNGANNVIEISIGSLIHSTSRTYKVIYQFKVPDSEILAK